MHRCACCRASRDGYNRKGLLSEENEPKLAFDVLREFYARIAHDEATTEGVGRPTDEPLSPS